MAQRDPVHYVDPFIGMLDMDTLSPGPQLRQIPAWHTGAGGDSWIFVDEIIIN